MNIMKRCKTPTRSGIESVDKHRSYTVNLDDRSSDHAEHISDHHVNKTVSNVTVFFTFLGWFRNINLTVTQG